MQDASRIDRSAQGWRARCNDAWRLSRLWGVVTICAWACTSATAQEAGETIVRLYATAVVSADRVTLSDVAEVRGDAAALMSQMELGSAPASGQGGIVEMTHIQSMLARRGAKLSNWVFRGASRCTVRRVGRPPHNPPADGSTDAPAVGTGTSQIRDRAVSGGSIARSAAGTEASRTATTAPADRSTVKVDPNTLEALLRDHLSKRLEGLGGRPVIRFSPAAARALTLSRPTYDFQIANRGDRRLGMVPLEVTVFEGAQVKQTIPLLAEVGLKKSVIVAVRPINGGEIIKPGHIVNEERVFDRAEDIGICDPARVLGQRAKHFIDGHAIFGERDIEPMPLILANDLVTVSVRRGQLTIRGSAKALSTGGIGDTVKLRNEMSKEVFSAVVTGQKTAEVREAGVGGKSTGSPSAVAVAQSSALPREGRP